MYIYAQLNEEDICVGYKNLSTEIVHEKEYVYVGKDVNINDILYSKYNYESNTFSKDKYYPRVEEVPNEINVIKDKIDILKAENLRLKEVEKEQDKMIMDNAYKMTILETSMGGM